MPEQQTMTDEQMVQALQQCTDSQLVNWYMDFRDYLKREAEAQENHIAPYVKKQSMVQQELHRRLLERNPNWQPGMKASGTTETATFFLKTDNSLRVADKEEFFKFLVNVDSEDPVLVMNTVLDRLRQFVTAHVAKEGVESYLDQIEQYRREHGGALPPGVNSALPPGINLERITKLQVRKV